ncbi:MAG: DUF4325 domain-containing protein [Spirochaetales bacterium]|nr:DUF4325 domain-containing protein [Spirochaetales bacterium]
MDFADTRRFSSSFFSKAFGGAVRLGHGKNTSGHIHVYAKTVER